MADASLLRGQCVTKLKQHNASENTPLLPKIASQVRSVTGLESAELRRWLGLFFATFILVAIGVFAGMFIEGWRFLTALYFVAQIVTTIGYGDFTPTHNITKVFTAVYILCCLVLLGYVVNLFAQEMAKLQSNFIRKRLRHMEATLFRERVPQNVAGEDMAKLEDSMREKYGHLNKLVAATVTALVFIVVGTIFFATYEACSCSFGRSRVTGCSHANYEVCKTTGGYLQTWGTAFYMSVVTLTTVGFGDHTPKSMLGRGLGIVWMFCGVASIANWVAQLSVYFLQDHLTRTERLQEAVTEDNFKEIDADGDGKMSLSEYRAYVLVKHGLISQRDLDIIDEHFASLDKERTGCVTLDVVKKMHATSGSYTSNKRETHRTCAA